MSFSFELVASAPWSATGLREQIISLEGGIATPGEPYLVRLVPTPVRAADGTLWLIGPGGRLGRWLNDVWSEFSIVAGDVGDVVDAAPLHDGSVVVLGQKGGQQNVLARIHPDGALLWRRTGLIDYAQVDLPALRGDFNCLRLDFDGTLYLPGTRSNGVISRVDPRNGATPVTIRLGDYRGAVWIQRGKVFRVVYEANRRSWAVREISSGREQKGPGDAPLQEALAVPRSPLPDDGALLSNGGDLMWMAPDGSLRTQLPLAGVVRMAEGLAVGIRKGTGLRVELWRRGEETGHFEVGPVPSHATLIHVDQEKAVVSETTSLGKQISITFARKGQASGVEDDSPSSLDLLEIEGSVNTLKVLVEPDGSVLIVGVDVNGVYITRVRAIQF